MSDQTTDRKPTVVEVVRSLTGFDELAIEAKFRAQVSDLEGTKLMRVLVFTLERRAGNDDKAAYGTAMRLTLGDIDEAFSKPVALEDEGEGES
jgi:hypothetical protein